MYSTLTKSQGQAKNFGTSAIAGNDTHLCSLATSYNHKGSNTFLLLVREARYLTWQPRY